MKVFILRFMNSGFQVGENQEQKRFSHIRYDKIVTLLSDLLQAGIEKEGFKPSLPVEDIVKMLMSTVDGILVQSLAFGVKKIDAEHQMDGLLHRVEKLLKDEQFS